MKGKDGGSDGVFYGYYLAILTFSLGFVGGCVYLYSRGVFVRDQILEFGADRTEISLVFTVVQIVSTAFAPVLGYLLDRYPIRHVMIAGAVATGAGFIRLSQVQTLLQFALVAALFLGFGLGCIGTTANTKLMVNWFNRRRGFALGVAIMGYSVAGTFMAPVALFLMESVGWRGAYLLFAAVVLVIVLPAVMILVRQHPKDIGLAPDGDAPSLSPSLSPSPEVVVTTQVDPEIQQTTLGLARGSRLQKLTVELRVYMAFLRSTTFWGVVFTFGLMAGTFGGFNVHLFLYYTELGIEPYWATFILSFTSAVAIASKPMFGLLIDWVNPRLATMFACACCMGAMLCFSSYTQLPMLFVAGGLFGLGFGGMIPVRAAIISRLFSIDEYARAYGSLRLCMFPLTISWMPLIGYIYDTQGSYTLAFQLFVGLFFLSLLIAWRLIPRRIDSLSG